MADRIAVMDVGCIAQLGTGEEIYRYPNSRYVADFIGEANLLPCTVGDDGALRLYGSNDRIPYQSKEAARDGSVLLLLRPESIDLTADHPPENTVSLQVVVHDKVFVGSGVKLYARTAAGLDLVLLPANRGAIELLRPGEPVAVHWRHADGQVLTR
jgi:spermidine/putrescine transport system ATP-binding protein